MCNKLGGGGGGDCCLRHPFSPVLKPRQGEGRLFYCWTGLTWPQDIMPATMPATRHPLGVATCAEAPHLVPPVGGFIRALPAYSLPSLAHILCSVSFFASNNIKDRIKSIQCKCCSCEEKVQHKFQFSEDWFRKPTWLLFC